ncbi:MAG: hypothetical protein ABIT36_00210 [Steroidobacteraceae bacterium]
MPVLLSRQDAQLAAAGCRSLAFKLRTDEEKQGNVQIREGMLRSAMRLERLAQLFDDHAVSTPADHAPLRAEAEKGSRTG